MGFNIIQLSDILCDDQAEEVFHSIINEFECQLNEDVELFLRDKAIQFERMDLSRTYLVYAKYKGKNTLVGYYALAMKDLTLRTGVSGNKRRKISGYKDRKSCAVYLIGQLAKNYKDKINSANLLTGKQLLRLAIDSIISAHKMIGGRAIIVECKDIYYLKRFYEEAGFTLIDSDKSDGLLRYFIGIETVNSLYNK